MSTLHQKRNRNLANYPLSTRSMLSSNAAPRNLRLICDQIEAGNAGIQAHIQELSNAAAAITQGISALKAQLTRESHHFHVFRTVVASFLGRPMPVVSAEAAGPSSTARMRACSVGDRISTTHTPTKAKKRNSCVNDDAEADKYPRKRRRLPSCAYDAHLKFRNQHDISTYSGSTSNNSDCRGDPRLSSLSSPASFPTVYSKPNRHTSPQLKSAPPSDMAPHTDWFYTKYDFRRKHWIFVRDRRATEQWKIVEEKEQKEVYQRFGTLQINLDQCCQAVDTTLEFQFDWTDYDVPYAGDDIMLTPSHSDYPWFLKGKPPPEHGEEL